LLANFDKPIVGQPSLLHHTEVITFFHEFGHIIHNMATETTIMRFSGTSTEMDFVELPSQMLENWMWDKDVISRVSKHYQTGEKLPEKILTKMTEAKLYGKAMSTLKQIFFGSFDLMLHSALDQKMLNEKSNATINFQDIRKGIKKNGFLVDSLDLWRTMMLKLTGIAM
jgi:thimet oligopeptidase